MGSGKLLTNLHKGSISTTFKAGRVQSIFKQGATSAVLQYSSGIIPPLYVAEYQAILDRATSLGYAQPSATVKGFQNQLVVALKAAGIWALLDVLYVGANDSGNVNFSRINWVAPSTFGLTSVNAPSWTSIGWQGNGSTSYFDSLYTPSINGINTSTNGASMGCYQKTKPTVIAGNGGMIGMRTPTDSAYTYFAPNIAGTSLDWRIFNASDGTSYLADTSNCFIHGVNDFPTVGKLWINGVFTQNTVNVNAMIMPTTSFSIGTAKGNTGAFSNAVMSMAFMGADLTGKELAFYNAWNTYRVAIGL